MADSGGKSLKKDPKHRFAAIDIGSNAIRMVVAEHSVKNSFSSFKVLEKYRLPIRLGSDVFSNGKISGKYLKEAARTFKKFRELAEKYKVLKLRAVGTSALREATNQKAFVELMYRKSGIQVEIIDGVEEARLIHLAVKREVPLENSHALLIDIGGGSVELTFSDNMQMTATQSFPFGTVRTLERLKKKKLTEAQIHLLAGDFLGPLDHFIKSHAPTGKVDFAVGTGGNIETLGKLKRLLLKSPSHSNLTFDEISDILLRVQKMSMKERVDKLDLRPDRADVIVPATFLLQTTLRQAGISRLLIPHVGLKDGLLWSMVQDTRFRS